MKLMHRSIYGVKFKYIFIFFIIFVGFLIYLSDIWSTINRYIKFKNEEIYLNNNSETCKFKSIDETPIIYDRTIFFIETSLNSTYLKLKPRQACAIESASKLHPNMNVVLLSVAPESQDTTIINKLIENYKNLRILHIDINTYVNGTPVNSLITHGTIWKSEWKIQHLSDILRFLTLWKYGGIYLDLDVVITKNLEDIGPNFTGFESSTSIAAGVLGFSYNYKYIWVENILNDLNQKYSPTLWSYSSLGVLRNEINKICNTIKIEEMSPERCFGYKIMPEIAFYPIPYPAWKQYFLKNTADDVLKKISSKENYAAHMWNKLSEKMNPEEDSAYRILAAKFCPEIYSITKEHF